MTELLTAAQMRAIETAAIESGEVTGLELMERAGRGVVEAVFEEWPEMAAAPHRAVVLCGPGNNGGDGFVVARLLKEWGWEVEVFLYGDPEKLPPDARANWERWAELGEVVPLSEQVIDHIDAKFEHYALVVDGLFGTGLTRAFDRYPRIARGLRSFRDSAEPEWLPKVVAIDIPSGLCADSGRWLSPGVARDAVGGANLTVSFHAAKRGHYLDIGPDCCGRIVVADIGLASTFKRKNRIALARAHGIATAAVDKAADPVLTREICFLQHGLKENSASLQKGLQHKYDHGHALILSGGAGRGGAGRLAARGALRVGAGLVTVGCPPAALQENAAQLNAIMLKSLGSDENLTMLLEGDPRLKALCLGPGFGSGARERQMVSAALTGQRATVLDADALTLLASDKTLFAALHDKCVLTPHAGEFARLFPDIAEKLNAPATTGPAYSKVDATREAAKRAGCTVLFKGPDTVIADPDGRCSVNSAHYDRFAPWLATAGSGDELAGFITGLLARGFQPMQAAETAAWLHVECALKFGPGLIAEDLPEMLPKVFADLGL